MSRYTAFLLLLLLVIAAGTVACSGDEQTPSPPEQGEPAANNDGDPALCDDCAHDDLCNDTTGLDIYKERIAPLLDEDRPSTCNRCHLQGTNLDLFVRGNPCEAMTCLLEKGLVDFEEPHDSLILTWIRRGSALRPGMPDEAVRAEYDGFLEWIEYSSACHDSICGELAPVCPNPSVAPVDQRPEPCPEGELSCQPEPNDPCEDEDPFTICASDTSTPCQPDDPREGCAPCQPLSVATTFHDRFSPWRGRCEHCHSVESMLTIGSPPWWLDNAEGIQYAANTLANLEELEAFDLDDPSQSRLLLKPLSEELGGIRHGGGEKFLGLDDGAYLDLLAFVEYYAECRADGAQDDPETPGE